MHLLPFFLSHVNHHNINNINIMIMMIDDLLQN